MCSSSLLTDYFRNGNIKENEMTTCPEDYGLHTICAQVTQEFLDFTHSTGNELSTSHQPSFSDLNEDDK